MSTFPNPFEPPTSSYEDRPQASPAVSLGSGSFFNYTPNTQHSNLSDDDRAEIKLEEMVTRGQLRRQNVDRMKDDVSAQLIAQDIKDSQDRVSQLEQRLAETQALFSAPPPTQQTSVKLNPAELWGSLLGSVVTGRPEQVANEVYGIAAKRQQAEFENDMRKYGVDQATAQRMYAAISRQLQGEQGNLSRFAQEQIQNEQLLRQQGIQQEQFDQSTQLRKADDERQNLKLSIDTFNRNINQYWNAGGEIPEAVRASFQAQRDDLVRQGVNPNLLTQIPTGQTLRAQDVSADNQRAQDRLTLDRDKFDQSLKNFEKSMSLKERMFVSNQRYQQRIYDQRVKEFNTKLANGYYSKQPRAQADDLAKVLKPLDTAIENLNTQLAGLNKKYEAKQAELRNAGEFQKPKIQAELNSIDAKRQEIVGMLDYRTKQKREHLPPIDQARSNAISTINSGKDPDWVRRRFKELYGEDL